MPWFGAILLHCGRNGGVNWILFIYLEVLCENLIMFRSLFSVLFMLCVFILLFTSSVRRDISLRALCKYLPATKYAHIELIYKKIIWILGMLFYLL